MIGKFFRWFLHLFGLHSWQYGMKADDYGRTCKVCPLDQEMTVWLRKKPPAISNGKDRF